jgi:hypothetical protein
VKRKTRELVSTLKLFLPGHLPKQTKICQSSKRSRRTYAFPPTCVGRHNTITAHLVAVRGQLLLGLVIHLCALLGLVELLLGLLLALVVRLAVDFPPLLEPV